MLSVVDALRTIETTVVGAVATKPGHDLACLATNPLFLAHGTAKTGVNARGEQHCVAGEALPYGGRTHGWELQKPERFKEPVPYAVKAGCVVWALKD